MKHAIRLSSMWFAAVFVAALAPVPASSAIAPSSGIGLAQMLAGRPARGQFVAPADRGIASDVAFSRDTRDYGPIAANHPVQIGLLMRVRNEAELKTLIVQQSVRGSKYYHHYLTTAQYAAYFAPAVATYARVAQTLQKRGFRITQLMHNRSMIRATAPASIVERYFATKLHAVYQLKYGYRYVNVLPARMPAELRDAVISVAGLHDTINVSFPRHVADVKAIRKSATYARALANVRIRQGLALKRAAARMRRRPQDAGRAAAIALANGHGRFAASPSPSPHPIGTTVPTVAGPDPTESPENADTDYVDYYGYGPPIYATGYDYPVEHGYGGSGFAAGSVISNDYKDSDAAMEYTTFNIDRTGTTSKTGYRVCVDPTAGPTCDNLIGAGDPEGESTLDAVTILSLAPQADFYEFLAPDLNDIGIEFAYETAVDQNVVSVVNSSFGGCETSDPTFEYAGNYIAMEGAALGITFSASSGDNGAFSCGAYASNGVPQTERDIFTPAADAYFVAVGGTSYLAITPADTSDYNAEQSWQYSGGGFSVYEPINPWQTALVGQASASAMASTTLRNIPDVSFCADPGTNPDGFVGGVDGVSFVITHNGALTASGGTSLASPMYVAMQTEIDQVQHSRNGLVTPSLYAIAAANAAEYAFAFNDVAAGTNSFYAAVPGYDLTTGIGSIRGWELAGAAEYGQTPVAPVPLNSPTPGPVATPAPTASPTPASTNTPHASGTSFAVTTIAGAMCPGGSPDAPASAKATMGNATCIDNPTGVLYVASATTGSQSTTDNVLFFNDFATGYVRAMDLTTGLVQTEEDRQFNNTTRQQKGNPLSNLFGLAVVGPAQPLEAGLYVASAGDGQAFHIALPTTPDPSATPGASFEQLPSIAGLGTNSSGSELGQTDVDDGAFHIELLNETGYTDHTPTTALPVGGNYGLTMDGSTPANWVVVDSAKNTIVSATDNVAASTVTTLAAGAPLNLPKGITYLSSTGSFYVANCGGNDIVKVTAAGVMSVVAGYGGAAELDGKNTGAGFDCPFGIANDGTNLYVTDLSGNAIREITNVL